MYGNLSELDGVGAFTSMALLVRYQLRRGGRVRVRG